MIYQKAQGARCALIVHFCQLCFLCGEASQRTVAGGENLTVVVKSPRFKTRDDVPCIVRKQRSQATAQRGRRFRRRRRRTVGRRIRRRRPLRLLPRASRVHGHTDVSGALAVGRGPNVVIVRQQRQCDVNNKKQFITIGAIIRILPAESVALY